MLQTLAYWVLFIVVLSFFGSVIVYAERAARQAMKDRADFQRRSAYASCEPENEAPKRLAA